MKQVSIVILFITSFYFHSLSQDKVWVNKNYVGFHVGATQSGINMIFNDGRAYLIFDEPAITAGISFKNFSEQLGALNVGISVDVNYLKKGGDIYFNLDTNNVETANILLKYKPTYIEFIPLMDLSLGKKWFHVNFLAGPHFSYIIKENIEVVTETNNTYKQQADNKFEFGLDVGGGIDFEFGRSNIELRFMYGFGFTDIFNADEINVDLWYNQNRVMSGLLYYYYKL